MKLSSGRHRYHDRDSRQKTIVGTRFHELYFTPLPSNADCVKVKKILQPTGVNCKDVRIHKGRNGSSAFVVFHSDADAADVLKAFRADPLFVCNKRVEVRYTVDYSDETNKPGQRVVTRIREAFNWMTEHNISIRDLPAELDNIVGTTSFTDVSTTFSCDKRYTECAFFNDTKHSARLVKQSQTVICPAPEPVIYKASEVLALYRKLKAPQNNTPKTSKSSKKKSAKKRQTLAKIEAALFKQENPAPLLPGMGRGFSQQRPNRSLINQTPKPLGVQNNVTKPCAVICPIKREVTCPTFEELKNSAGPTEDQLRTNSVGSLDKTSDQPLSHIPVLGRGRGIASLSNDMLKELSQY